MRKVTATIERCGDPAPSAWRQKGDAAADPSASIHVIVESLPAAGVRSIIVAPLEDGDSDKSATRPYLSLYEAGNLPATYKAAFNS